MASQLSPHALARSWRVSEALKLVIVDLNEYLMVKTSSQYDSPWVVPEMAINTEFYAFTTTD
ncbi:hypothetical protein L861_18025 [Litchfieldella anticariensis FP35 = DSM 16096]|uniref:Uncharacterized protein n=1 Tax=Litchfieldella anticariensis (strain DSM 16096 / CECT 5854 / CIP 108499 / LMG 22089 / FP35) TaxID=1121939 RepID=S2LFF6_LITA3|nr:hypothetical protein [Halomonas anticariensis]EPC03436.1 hypothetical protein L861_18025 [Halomonas anticariensis FP35 = DSM 16096]